MDNNYRHFSIPFRRDQIPEEPEMSQTYELPDRQDARFRPEAPVRRGTVKFQDEMNDVDLSSTRRDAFFPNKQATSQQSDSERHNSNTGSLTQNYAPATVFTGGNLSIDKQELSNANAFKCDIMIKHLRQRQLERNWSYGGTEQGVVLKRAKDDFICKPGDLLSEQNGFFEQIRKLNVKAAMTVKTEVVESFLSNTNQSYIPFEQGLRLQVLPSMAYLSRCKKHHYAAFIKDTGLLVVWDDSPEGLIERAEHIQEHLVSLLWKEPDSGYAKSLSDGDSVLEGDSTWTTLDIDKNANLDDDTQRLDPGAGVRKTILLQPMLSMVVSIIAVVAIGLGWRKIAIEIKIDHSYWRLLLLIPFPLQLWLGWFFFQTIVSCFFQMFGSVAQVHGNSRFYSGIRTKRITGELPHVTVQCPVYKEGLWAVIDPTMASVRNAISTYEMQGGTVNIFVNDDGLQLLPANEVRERIEYYEEHNIGWVARPKHSPKGDKPFIRPGKFKKASNMNYGMNISVRVEDKLKFDRPETWTQFDEDAAYLDALEEVVKEDEGRTWAGGDVRMGDYILILDSDSRVPTDCFLDAVSEMEASPNIAIIQYSSGVMNVTTSFFERGITFFTKLVFTAIRFAVASGDVAPFIGHNAILRWSAIQEIAYFEENVEKWWSEETVSEDFDIALRLQAHGFDLRFSSYFNEDFAEGVSLTVYDELARWEKYAFGCAELVFHPFHQWITRGPFTKLFRQFVFSRINLASKMTIMAYIGTYYALASAWILTVANYFLIGWYAARLDHYYLSSFNVYIAVITVFSGLGTLSLAVLRYRSEDRNFFSSLLENLTWLLLLTTFLGGVSIHVSQAILCHMFGVNMTWGSTAKEETKTSFFQEVPTIMRKFKFTFCFCLFMVAVMIILAGVGPVGKLVPYQWRITDFVAIWPMSTIVAFHFLMPLILNPGLMQFSF